VWYVSKVARVKLVSASIDGPSHFLVIRFEREGEERFARFIGGEDWRERKALDRLFTESDRVDSVERPPPPTPPAPNDDVGIGPAPLKRSRCGSSSSPRWALDERRASRSGPSASGTERASSTCAERSSEDGASSLAYRKRPAG
jgi:hypothetical protein